MFKYFLNFNNKILILLVVKLREKSMQNYDEDIFLNDRVVGKIKVTIYKIYYQQLF